MKASSLHHKLHKILPWIGGIMIVLLVANFCYQIWTKYAPHHKPSAALHCELQDQLCAIKTREGETIEIDLTPRPFTPGSTVTATVTITAFLPKQVFLLMFPVGKQPSLKPIELKPINTTQFSSQVVLPPEGEGKWILMIAAKGSQKNITVPFHLTFKKKND